MGIESIYELGKCTDVEMLKKQHNSYVDVMNQCCVLSPNCRRIAELILADPIVSMYLSALSAKTSIRIRIRELEGKNDD